MEEKKELLDQDERVVEIELERLRGFVNHPFKVQANSQMIELQESIKKYGILNPLIVRPRQDGTYEIISGHRRKFAAEKIGYRILSADEDRMGYEKYFMEQLNIEALKQDYPYDREMIDGIMELILDVVCSKRKIICIAGDVKSVNVVKGRFMKLNMEHVRYVMNCMQENTTKIRSIKQYMLAALYNAPATIDSYYRAEVNHDMAEGKI